MSNGGIEMIKQRFTVLFTTELNLISLLETCDPSMVMMMMMMMMMMMTPTMMIMIYRAMHIVYCYSKSSVCPFVRS